MNLSSDGGTASGHDPNRPSVALPNHVIYLTGYSFPLGFIVHHGRNGLIDFIHDSGVDSGDRDEDSPFDEGVVFLYLCVIPTGIAEYLDVYTRKAPLKNMVLATVLSMR